MTDAVCDLLHKAIQVALHLDGDIARVERAFVGVAEDGRGAAVRRHHHEAVGCVEDVEGGVALGRAVGRGHL